MSFVQPLLKGKTALITGGTTGIGRGIALEFLRQGCNVSVNHLGLSKADEEHRQSILSAARDIKQGKEATALPKSHGSPSGSGPGGMDGQKGGGGSAEAEVGSLDPKLVGEMIDIPGDVSDPATGEKLVAETVRHFGKLDILVANAGVFRPAEFLNITPTLLEQTVNTNLNGTFYTCQAAARRMVSQGHGGSIIAISSISALQGGRYQTHYTPTKSAILSLMQSMSISLGAHSIRCNAILPGTVRSQLSAEEIGDDTRRERLLGKIPLGRVGEPGDMAGPAVFLASERMSGWMTGAGVLVDGGMFAFLQ